MDVFYLHVSAAWMSLTTEILFITVKSAFIIAACHCMWHMADAVQCIHCAGHKCFQMSVTDRILSCNELLCVCVCTVHVRVCLQISAGTADALKVPGGSTQGKVNKQRLKKKGENIAILEALLCDSWLQLTTWFHCAYLPPLLLIKQVWATSHYVKLLCWHKMSYKPLNYHLYLCLHSTSQNKFILAQLNNEVSTCNQSWSMGLEERNSYRDELPRLCALHWSCSRCISKSTTPSSLCPLALHKDVSCCVSVPQSTQPTFSPPGVTLCVCVYWCVVCITVASAGDFVFHYILYEEENDNSVCGPEKCVYCMFLISWRLSWVFSLWRFDGQATHLQVPTCFLGLHVLFTCRYACVQNTFM